MKKKKKLKIYFYIIITIGVYINTLNLLNDINLDIKNDKFYKILISESSNLNNKINYNKIKNIINLEPNKLINNNIIYTKQEEPIKEVVSVLKKEKIPTVYIYNTHQTENYSNEYLADYSIVPNIMITSYMLKENLEEYGIYSYVEERSIKEVLNKNKWKYSKSYKVSRSFMEEKQKEIPTFKYYIDLHRDSVKKKHTTIEIDGIKYAKIMLLVGLEHNSYKDNLKEAEKINNKLNKYYPGISRGIYKKSGSGVNGIYNQDFSKYVFLFEIGGIENNIEEVNNTMIALTKVLVEYIKEEGDLIEN
ncbi:MAG: stage II sporulation protein P [Bacilli bacterium]|nr:stage II sporulation protein P [Bacilli bacterium]